MLAKVGTCAVVGLEGALVEVEVDIGHGLPAFSIVGLPDTAVTEAKERVRAAVKNSGCIFPLKRITVNLAPADLRKEGPAYDLPIAMGLLLASVTAVSGRPTMLKAGRPWPISTSTSTSAPSSPTTAQVPTFASIAPASPLAARLTRLPTDLAPF